ncbi:MAG: hypothetical protein B7Y45_09100 [Sphingomonas sp. 28-66-16]|nr:MAG: hypothetical protein B7Y45_09100 [Sphingomonas sp. 28-66-16]
MIVLVRRVGAVLTLLAAASVTAASPPAVDRSPAMPTPALLEALRAADLRLAAIGLRLTTSNAALCRELQPRLGVQWHALSQYQPPVRSAVRANFHFATDTAIEVVVPAGPADKAGVHNDDGLISIDGSPVKTALPAAEVPASTLDRDAIDARIAKLPPDRPIRLGLERDGARLEIAVVPVPGCRVRFEVHDEDEASSDDSIIQIGASFLDRYDDNALAVIVAHELGHVILRSRARLEAAGAKWGILSEFGKSGRLHHQAEAEADRLSVYLLANAGYDPMLAGQFWRGAGRSLDLGILRNRAYPDWKTRAANLDAEAAKIPAGVPLPYVPPMISLRDTPMK